MRKFLFGFSDAIKNTFIIELLHESMNSMYPDPSEGRFLIVCMICLLYQTDRLKNICDIVKSSDLGLQLLSLL